MIDEYAERMGRLVAGVFLAPAPANRRAHYHVGKGSSSIATRREAEVFRAAWQRDCAYPLTVIACHDRHNYRGAQ